uniref:WGS project CAEQ00000000 data, annotated contig 877 n=1 Tax=Trypanosoma congolense (strain IL3000) TaxID=1068625 RepID=F9WJ69_TRYCI|nr:unnamed protein product [Trypanosoma congolense IL3000]
MRRQFGPVVGPGNRVNPHMDRIRKAKKSTLTQLSHKRGYVAAPSGGTLPALTPMTPVNNGVAPRRYLMNPPPYLQQCEPLVTNGSYNAHERGPPTAMRFGVALQERNESQNVENADMEAENKVTPGVITPPCTSPRRKIEEGSPLKEMLRRIILLEFASKCSERSITIVQTICEVMCKNPAEVVEVMLALEACFCEAVKEQKQQRLLNYWYIVDAIMKLFRDKPDMLEAIFIALPHLLLLYVPWSNSNLAKEHWMVRDRDAESYENLFRVWEYTVPEKITNDIKNLWKNGLPGVGSQ